MALTDDCKLGPCGLVKDKCGVEGNVEGFMKEE